MECEGRAVVGLQKRGVPRAWTTLLEPTPAGRQSPCLALQIWGEWLLLEGILDRGFCNTKSIFFILSGNAEGW